MRVVDFCRRRSSVPAPDGIKYGVEVELEDYKGNTYNERVWQAVPDGSLRNNGIEFVFRGPLTFNDSLSAISDLYSGLDGRFSTGVRTSTHVHIDARERVVGGDLDALLAAYSIVEPLLFAMCGDTREQNIYCVPWYRDPSQAALYVQALSRKQATRDPKSSVASTFNNANKYTACNLKTLYKFGSLELRMAPMWDSAEDSKKWLKTIHILNSTTYGKTATEVLDAFYYDSGGFIKEYLGVNPTNSDLELIDDVDSPHCAELIRHALVKDDSGEWKMRNNSVLDKQNYGSVASRYIR